MIESKELLDAAQVKMDKVIAHLTEELASVRAGKASVNVLNGILVEYYGTPTDISQVASITVPGRPHRTGAAVGKENDPGDRESHPGRQHRPDAVEQRRAHPAEYSAADEERRKELVKQIKAETETARVSLRGIRRDLVDAFKKAQKDGMPEDAAKDGEESAQKLTDKYAKKVDDLFSAKEKEIMTV